MTIKARDLVATRNFVKKFITVRSRLQAINLKLTVCFVCFFFRVMQSTIMTTFLFPLQLIHPFPSGPAPPIRFHLRVQTAKSTEAMISSLKGVTKAMGAMNKSMNLPNLQKLMQQFQMADAQLEDKTEMMGDAIDDAVAEDGDSEEEAEIVGRVLDEIGIDFNGMVQLLNIH